MLLSSAVKAAASKGKYKCYLNIHQIKCVKNDVIKIEVRKMGMDEPGDELV